VHSLGEFAGQLRREGPRWEIEMKSKTLMVAALLVAMFCGAAVAATSLESDWLKANLGIKTSGPLCFQGLNTSTTDTLERGEVVGASVAPVTVVAKYQVGNAYDTATIAGALWTGTLETLGVPPPRVYPGLYPSYDTAKNSDWRLRVKWVIPAGAGTRYVYIKYYNEQGTTMFTTTLASTASVDTILVQPVTKVCSVYCRGINATDTLAIYAEPTNGVKVNTTLATAHDSSAYAGVVQEKVLPGRRGLVAFSGPAVVKIDATTNDIRNGYWITPSGTAGYATASTAAPALPIGRVRQYSQANGLALVTLQSPFFNTTVSGATDSIAQLAILVGDTVIVRTGAASAAFAATKRIGCYSDSSQACDTINIAALNAAGADVWVQCLYDTVYVKNGATVIDTLPAAGKWGYYRYIGAPCNRWCIFGAN